MHIVLVHPKQASEEYVGLAQRHFQKCQRMVQHEQNLRLGLEDMVQQLAMQVRSLEHAAKEHSIPVRDRGGECFRHSGAISSKMHEGLCCDSCELCVAMGCRGSPCHVK
jgi:hypothetical protein